MKSQKRIAILTLCATLTLLLLLSGCNIGGYQISISTTGTSPEVTDPEVTTPEETSPADLYKLEMQTVFEMAKNAGYTGTLEELIAMFRGEPGPAGKDGVTPHIGANGNWWVGDTDLGVPAQGIQGPQGEPGRGIAKMKIIDGELFVFYTDGTYENLGPVVGENTDTPNPPEITTPEQTTPEVPPVITPPIDDPDYNLPEKIDMQGYTYKAYVRDFVGGSLDSQIANGNNLYSCIDFWVDEANSENDAISFAVYQRNQKIENDYNCKIRQVSSNGSQIEHLLASYINGDGYDLTIITAKPAAQAATQNLLRNLKDTTYLDLSNSSYDPNSIKELSVADKLYFLSGDMNISTMDVLALSLVNMEFYSDLVETIVEVFDYDVTYANIYDVVMSKKWTMETMLKIAELANVDMDDSDGSSLSAIDNGDIIGYHQYFCSTLWYFYGSGGRITAPNEDGLPEFVIQNTTNQNLYNYIYDNFNRIVSVPWIPHASSNIVNQNFLTGNVLFTDSTLFNIRTEIYPMSEFEYGILPIPVYEEGMDYQSVVYFNNWAHLWAIPSLTNNTEYAERMMQVMATYSSLPDSTMYAYYERTVYLQAAANNGSRAVMDTIKNSMVYDMALLYPSWGNIEYQLQNIANSNVCEYASIVESIPRIKETMLETIDMLMNPGISE